MLASRDSWGHLMMLMKRTQPSWSTSNGERILVWTISVMMEKLRKTLHRERQGCWILLTYLEGTYRNFQNSLGQRIFFLGGGVTWLLKCAGHQLYRHLLPPALGRSKYFGKCPSSLAEIIIIYNLVQNLKKSTFYSIKISQFVNFSNI